MKRNEDFRKALGEPDEYFRQSVIDTLDQLNMQAEKKSRPQRRYSTRIIASFAALVLAVTGIIFSRQYIPGISPDGHIDTINPTPTVAKQMTVSPALDTVYATIFFREAQKDGDNIRFTLEIQPKFEHFLIVSANYLLTSSCKSTADFYGIQPEDPEQSMYSWIVDHGYQQAIAFELNPPWDGTDGIHENIYTQEKCQLRDDGSTVMTIVGPAADNNVYDLEWHMVPWNMEDRGDSFHPDLHIHGTIRLEVTDEKQCAVTVVTPSHLPDESRLKLFPAVVDTAYATLKVREAKTDGYGVFLQVEVLPQSEKTLVVANTLNIMNDSVRKLGIDERKSIYQWAVDNHYHLLIVYFNSPTDAIDSDTGLDRGFHPYWATPSFIEENGSTVIKAVGYAIPDTVQYELGFSLYSVDQDSSDNPRYNLLETGVIPVTVSETEEPKVIAEYKAVSSLSAEIPTPDATLTLLQSSCSDYCELRFGDTEHVFPDSVHYDFMLSNDFFADGEFVEWSKRGSSDFVLSYQAIEDDNTFVLRRSWAFPTEIPDKICLSGTSGYFSGLYEKVQ